MSANTQAPEVTESMIHAGIKALVGATGAEMECFNQKMLDIYSNEVTRTFLAMQAASPSPHKHQRSQPPRLSCFRLLLKYANALRAILLTPA